MPTVYPSLKIGAATRLAMFREEAAGRNWSRPLTWRDVRFATLASDTGLSQGFNGDGGARVPVWYTQDGRQPFRDERFCDDVARIDHQGWFADADGDETVRGIVSRLPHGRFIAGYLSSVNGERVYFADLFDDEREAAHMADEHARVTAESEREDSERSREAFMLEGETESLLQRLRECIALRHRPCMAYVRGQARELVETIRANRKRLSSEFADVL